MQFDFDSAGRIEKAEMSFLFLSCVRGMLKLAGLSGATAKVTPGLVQGTLPTSTEKERKGKKKEALVSVCVRESVCV